MSDILGQQFIDGQGRETISTRTQGNHYLMFSIKPMSKRSRWHHLATPMHAGVALDGFVH
jgi:hypothetical protein